jgi:hypothetical protein
MLKYLEVQVLNLQCHSDGNFNILNFKYFNILVIDVKNDILDDNVQN